MRTEIHREPIYTVLIIDSISPRKGQASPIQAVAKLKASGIRCRLFVVGSGPELYVNSLRKLTKDLGLSDCVIITGLLTDPYQVYMTSDCLLMCSENGAFGRVTAEAMSACLPIIGMNSGSTPEIIVYEKTGFLYNSTDELGQYMTLLATNPELAKQMGVAGWQRARDLYNTQAYAVSVFQVIQLAISDNLHV